MFCYSDDVDKELKYDEYISISLTDSHAPIQKNSVVPKKRHPKFGDPLETILMAPLQSVFCASTTQPKMTPTNHHLLININHLRFSLGHQGLPRLPPKPEETTCKHTTTRSSRIQWRRRRKSSPRFPLEWRTKYFLTNCPPWTSWNGGSITFYLELEVA